MERTIKFLKLPNCDECKSNWEIVPARYDAKTKYGYWAYLCEKCFKTEGIGLGVGRGTKLECVKEQLMEIEGQLILSHTHTCPECLMYFECFVNTCKLVKEIYCTECDKQYRLFADKENS